MLHSQASLVNLLKIKKHISNGFLSILLYHLVCWLGSKSSKVQTKSEEEKKYGDQDYRDHVSTVTDMNTYLVAALFTGSDQPSPLRKLKERLSTSCTFIMRKKDFEVMQFWMRS